MGTRLLLVLVVVYTATVCGGDQDEDDDSIFNCYFCQKNYKGYQSVAPELEQCLDPFNPDGVQTVQCRGKCYVQTGKTDTHQGIVRGCYGRDNQAKECQEHHHTDEHGVKYTRYCCDKDLCNGVDVETLTVTTVSNMTGAAGGDGTKVTAGVLVTFISVLLVLLS